MRQDGMEGFSRQPRNKRKNAFRAQAHRTRVPSSSRPSFPIRPLPLPHFLPILLTSSFKNTRVDSNDDDQTSHDQRRRNQGNERHAAPRGRELAADDPVLALKVAMEADEEDDDGDAEEGGAERLADLAQLGAGVGGEGRRRGRERRRRRARARRQRRVESEELRDGDADGGEGQ